MPSKPTADQNDARLYEMLRCGTPKPMKRAAQARPKAGRPEKSSKAGRPTRLRGEGST